MENISFILFFLIVIIFFILMIINHYKIVQYKQLNYTKYLCNLGWWVAIYSKGKKTNDYPVELKNLLRSGRRIASLFLLSVLLFVIFINIVSDG